MVQRAPQDKKDQWMEEMLREVLKPEELDQQEMTARNNLLKAQLDKQQNVRTLSVCYLPAMIHTLILLVVVLAVFAMTGDGVIRLLVVVLATAGCLSAVTVTRLGVRFFDLKRRMTVSWER